MNADLLLAPIDRRGFPTGYSGALSKTAAQALRATAGLYEGVGFRQPWIGYLAIEEEVPVGTCGFKGPPLSGRVEIAYFSFPGFEGRGFASIMAEKLVAIARGHSSSLLVAAQTLPTRNASHRILEKLGFQHVDTVRHPDDGEVWEWHLTEDSKS